MSLEERRAIDSVLLAVLRTELANRRTLLAYAKTAIALFAAGFALLHLLGETLFLRSLGVCFLLGAGAVMLVGVVDYRRTRREIEAERRDCGLPPAGG